MRELLACAVRYREFVQQEKATRDDEICRSQFRPAERNENADCENCRYQDQYGRSHRNELGHDNSDRSNQRQTNKWLARRAEQLHLLAVFAYRVLAAQAAICFRVAQTDRPWYEARLLASVARRNFSRAGPIRGSAGD